MKNEKKNTKAISYRLQFIDSPIFLSSSLSNLAIDIVEETYKVKYK